MAVVIGRKRAATEAGETLEKNQNIYSIANDRSLVYVLLANRDEEEEDVLKASGLPQIGTIRQGCICRRRRAEEIELVMNPYTGEPGAFWEVTADFDTNLDPAQVPTPGEPTPPELRRPKKRWLCEDEEEILPRDAITGAAIETGAGEPIAVTHPVTDAILEITRYELWPFDPLTIYAYCNHTNSTPFYGAPIGTARMQTIESEEEEIEGAVYERVTYRTKFKIRKDVDGDNPDAFRQDTWKGEVLNAGHFYYRSLSPKIAMRAVDDHGNDLIVKLAPNGLLLPPDADPTWILFNRYGKADFNDLDLGPYT